MHVDLHSLDEIFACGWSVQVVQECQVCRVYMTIMYQMSYTLYYLLAMLTGQMGGQDTKGRGGLSLGYLVALAARLFNAFPGQWSQVSQGLSTPSLAPTPNAALFGDSKATPALSPLRLTLLLQHSKCVCDCLDRRSSHTCDGLPFMTSATDYIGYSSSFQLCVTRPFVIDPDSISSADLVR